MILKCAIVDDEPLALELLASYVKKIPFLELTGKYGNAIESMNGLNDNPVDLIYLDSGLNLNPKKNLEKCLALL